MERLPNDVLIDILSRLQVKHLHQLKCVSKHWHKHISDPHFKKLHSTRWLKIPRLLIVQESTEGHPSLFGQPLCRTLSISTMNISTGQIHKEFTKDIIGRYCCYILSNNLICFENNMVFAVCNPTTHEIIYLPLPSPSKPSISYHLGYNLEYNEYKIMHLFRYSNLDKVGFEIVTLKDCGPLPKEWREIKNHTTNIWKNYCNTVDSVSMNGAIYWLVDGIGSGKRIICFDMKNAYFTSMCCSEEYVEIGHSKGDIEQLVNLRGFLCLVYRSKKFPSLTIFVLKDHANEMWVKEYIIDLRNMRHDLRVIGYVSGDDLHGGMVFVSPGGRPVLYNIKNKSFRKIGQIDTRIGMYKNLYFDRFFSLGNR